MEFKSLFDYLAIICTLRHPTWINAPSNKIANILSKAFYFHYNQRQPSLLFEKSELTVQVCTLSLLSSLDRQASNIIL